MTIGGIVPERSPRPPSLRGRLIGLATLVLVVALGLVGAALNAANYRGAVSSLEARMEAYVYLVLAAMEVDTAGGIDMGDLADPRLAQPGSGVYVTVAGRSGNWRSPSALGLELSAPELLDAGQRSFLEPGTDSGYFAYIYGVGWQMPDGAIEPFTVAVRIEAGTLREQTAAFRLGLWRALGAAGAILVLAQLLILFLVFRPLGRVAGDVARVESGAAPRLEGTYPRELEPLARNVNRLLDTEQSNQQRIRNALDSLAHSLKTPLAVIQAGLPLHGGEAEDSMRNAVRQMEHLIATRLQRAGSGARRTLAAPVAVAPQVQRIVASLEKVYSRKMIKAEVILEDGLEFYGEERDLLELVGNLADNAFKYGESAVGIGGGATSAEGRRPGLWLCFEDDGPGIDAAQWEQLLQRGVRGDERAEGHGLGLAIVAELVGAYGGEVRIGRSELGGAMVSVAIPPS